MDYVLAYLPWNRSFLLAQRAKSSTWILVFFDFFDGGKFSKSPRNPVFYWAISPQERRLRRRAPRLSKNTDENMTRPNGIAFFNAFRPRTPESQNQDRRRLPMAIVY